MIQRLLSQLPYWARPGHPLLRHELAKNQAMSARARYLRALVVVLLALFLLGVGYLIATGFLRHAPGQDLTASVSAVLFWPVLGLQLTLSIVALATTVTTVSEEKRRQTWDNLRATESGTELALRARWAAVFYRMRGLIGGLMLVRVVLLIGILYDLTAFRGGYLDMLTANITPELPVLVDALLLAFMMTAGILLPLTGVGLDASMGLLISTTVHDRVYSVIVQVLLVIARIAVTALLLIGVTQLTTGELQTSELLGWLLVAAFAAVGDWGLALLQLGFMGQIWALVPYAVFLGVALLAFALVQAVVTDWILGFAVRRAERTG